MRASFRNSWLRELVCYEVTFTGIKAAGHFFKCDEIEDAVSAATNQNLGPEVLQFGSRPRLCFRRMPIALPSYPPTLDYPLHVQALEFYGTRHWRRRVHERIGGNKDSEAWIDA